MMNKLTAIIILAILIIPSARGQDQNKVIVFEGRRVPFKEQKIMDLSFRNLKEVPTLVSNTEIEILILDNNKLEKVPAWIGNLKNLKILSIRNNNLKEISSSISFCENLEQLYLSGNKELSDIPNLSFCEKLEIIDVIDTKINDIPGWVRLNDNIYYFKYSGISTIQ